MLLFLGTGKADQRFSVGASSNDRKVLFLQAFPSHMIAS